MKVFFASVWALLALTGCAVFDDYGPLAMDNTAAKRHQPAKQKLAEAAIAKPKDEVQRVDDAAQPSSHQVIIIKPKDEPPPQQKWSAARLLNAVVIDKDGKRVARVEDLQLTGDGKPGLLAIVHGAEGTGTETVMMPFSQFKIVSGLDSGGDYKLQTMQTLKPLPEFAPAK